jgi:hypothetical protein
VKRREVIALFMDAKLALGRLHLPFTGQHNREQS